MCIWCPAYCKSNSPLHGTRVMVRAQSRYCFLTLCSGVFHCFCSDINLFIHTYILPLYGSTSLWTLAAFSVSGDSLRWPRHSLYPLKLALTWPTSGGRSVGIVHLRTKITEFVCFFLILYTVGSTFWTVDRPVARRLPTLRTTET
jgi:hypothetical protein